MRMREGQQNRSAFQRSQGKKDPFSACRRRYPFPSAECVAVLWQQGVVTPPFRLIAAAVLRMSVRGIVQEEALGVLPVRVCASVCLWERSYTIETFSFLPPSRDYRIVSVTLYPFASFFFSFSFLVRACVTRCDIISRFFLASFRLCWCFVVQVAYCGNNGSSCLKSCRKRRLPSNEE